MAYSSEVHDKGDPFSKRFGVKFTQKVYFHSNVYNIFQNDLHLIVPSKTNEAKGAPDWGSL